MASSLKFTNQNLDLLQKKETSTRNNQVSPKMIADNCTVAGNYAKSGGSCSRNYDNGQNSQRYDTEAGKVQNTALKFKLDFKDYSLMHWKVKINRFGMFFFLSAHRLIQFTNLGVVLIKTGFFFLIGRINGIQSNSC